MSYFIFHRKRGGDDPLKIRGVSEPRHYITPYFHKSVVYHGNTFSSQETLARYLALKGMDIAGVDDVFLPKFVDGGEWSDAEVAAGALEKKSVRRKLGLE